MILLLLNVQIGQMKTEIDHIARKMSRICMILQNSKPQSDIQTHPLFQQVLKYLVHLKNSKTHLVRIPACSFALFEALKSSLSKFLFLHIPLFITIIFYPFLLVWQRPFLDVVSRTFLKLFSVNPFQSTVSFLYPLETSENKMFSVVYRRYRNGTWG